MSETNEMPSSDINPGNALNRIQECHRYLMTQKWESYSFLYQLLFKFQEVRIRGAGKMLRDDDEFTNAWNSLRSNSVDFILKNLEDAQDYDIFILWLKRLSEIVTDHRSLWNILHTEVQCSLKVTAEQSHAIAATFFQPSMLFEFGLDSFLASDLCDFSNINTEDGIVDVFYATTGFIRGCNLSPSYEIKQPQFLDLVNRMLMVFTEIPNFNASCFVWLVESIHEHFHLNDSSLTSICKTVLENFTSNPNNKNSPIVKLNKLCIISTSPFLQSLSIIQDAINKAFSNVIVEQHVFVRKYIFGCFVSCLWEGPASNKLSDALSAWILYLKNLHKRISNQPELPNLLLIDFLDDSLLHFTGYYGEVQPTMEQSQNLRMDIFAVVEQVVKYYPNKIPHDTLQKIWFLLTIAAVCGASEDELSNIVQIDCDEKEEPYLGLEHDDKNFTDYKTALGRLSKKFDSELEAFPVMVDFIRKKYKAE